MFGMCDSQRTKPECDDDERVNDRLSRCDKIGCDSLNGLCVWDSDAPRRRCCAFPLDWMK